LREQALSHADGDCNWHAHSESYGDCVTNGHRYGYADNFTDPNGHGNRDAAHPYTICYGNWQAPRNTQTASHTCAAAESTLEKGIL
jgi:fermentation-respiration switch protein FrsA (DUF1100 family)